MNSRKLSNTLYTLSLATLLGCATSPWHETLMSNEQLIAASCQELAIEERRVAENMAHTAEASGGAGVGSVFLLVLEGVAASKTGTQVNPNNSGGVNMASRADELSAQARQLESRKNMIATVRNKKRCD